MSTERTFSEDLVPNRKRAVSISSVDSEPIKTRPRGDCDSVGFSSNDEGPGAVMRPAPKPATDGPADSAAVIAEYFGDAVLLAETDWVAVTPAERVSEAAVAVVVSTTPAKGVLVAEVLAKALPMDVGTRFCLPDGRTAGSVVSLLGPVHEPFYLVACGAHDETGQMLADGSLAPGAPLHYDLGCQQVIFSVLAQCDTGHGTDASYVNDDELPGNVRPDFSDDEKELRWKREQKSRRLADADVESVSSEEEPIEDIEWGRLDAECGELSGALGVNPAANQ